MPLIMVTGFSTAPLRLVSIIGFVFTLFGIAVLLWVIGIYFLYGSPCKVSFSLRQSSRYSRVCSSLPLVYLVNIWRASLAGPWISRPT